MTYTIWSNGGRYEFLIYKGDDVVTRSGLVHPNHGSAKRACLKAAAAL